MPSDAESSEPAAADVAAAIAASPTGAIRFDEYMRLALYGEHGFYTGVEAGAAGGRAGRRGDFLTAAEVGPLFAAVVARALDAWWDDLGRPDPFPVVDVGAGPGTLARGVIGARPRCAAAMRYVAVELSPTQRATHPDDVVSTDEMPTRLDVGVVIANELLDNLPFRLLVFDGGWREAWVTRSEPDGRLVEVLAPIATAPPWLPDVAPLGVWVPWHAEADAFVRQTLMSLARGRVVAFDYAVATTAQLAVQPWREWLRTYRRHGRGEHYLRAVGAQDITADVALDQLPEPDAIRTQAQFLQRWGIEELVEEGRRQWAANAARPTVATLAMRSRVREAEALLDPAGLGSFLVIEWCRSDEGGSSVASR